jgi:hypothetical protein
MAIMASVMRYVKRNIVIETKRADPARRTGIEAEG